jgi:ketosteroid isomerase-like protein
MNNKLVALAREYWTAEESRDISAILEFFSEDARWTGPDGVTLVGHTQIRTFYENSAALYPGLTVSIMRTYGDEHEGAVEWSANLTAPDGRVLHLNGINIMKRSGDKFTDLTAYFDQSAF